LSLGVVASMLLAKPAFASGSTLYVDSANPQCSDTGSGSQTVPYCTINKGASVATAGQTVQVASGTYPELVTVGHSGSAGSPIVLMPAPGATVTVSGKADAFKVSGRSYVTIQGFTVSGSTSYGIYVTSSSSNVTVRNTTVTGTAGAGIYIKSSSNVTVSGNDVSDSASYGIYDNASPPVTISD